ncbi:UDP-N-acetylmuramoyl-L-alanyl-D-glutamate--2,6-diaminopimelate ligase [Kitasatospora sp. MAP5-34]|uniref:UDP-N-acetylmuramoyl-L-alanyl-D-glutamate--2, 6-diaminopimelate ligase n=1 Tax=Kitasatospora sp. MAP5-34 TaxID=3035102 RepID=UPI0024770C39|nr:UDP-N-acetylmuramoyl-L-alanyl-D-glutamate--2,6-diaminopimelate ligase [Kitasatospora sp. MAP5-34]MDH6577358.1 UDP-N-acetylmuramoyl-L-alanyl-D-glutamate--2,6-diaminopimelate ligase [Kitasatospora sp. MAP5-34]
MVNPTGSRPPDQASWRAVGADSRRAVRLSELMAGWPGAEHRGRDVGVVDCTHDSRQVRPGWLFCALSGAHFDGHDYAETAVRAGARALLVQHFLDLDVPQLRVPNVRWAIGPVAAVLHGRPADGLSIAGLTGTNGKTTVSYLLHSAFVAAGWPAARLGTVETRIGRHRWTSPLTTLEATELQRAFVRMRREGVRAVAMEVSSHALDQHRVGGVTFDVAVFTNLEAEHLDYHGTMEQYYYAKSLLFTPERCRQALVCVDDEWGVRLAHQSRVPTTTFGRTDRAQVRITDTTSDLNGTRIRLEDAAGSVELSAPVVGACHATNVAAAYLAARALGVPAEAAATGIATCEPIPGRSELVDVGQPFLVVVDYAHTPGALRAQIETARRLVERGGQVHLVVGCRGGRDRHKRPDAGRAAMAADTVILTSDSPGDEDRQGIVSQMLAGMLERPDREVVVELDRAAAIGSAVAVARPGDVVLILGRGHETTQSVAGRAVPFDDREQARAVLTARGWADGGSTGTPVRRKAERLRLGVVKCHPAHGATGNVPSGVLGFADEGPPYGALSP